MADLCFLSPRSLACLAGTRCVSEGGPTLLLQVLLGLWTLFFLCSWILSKYDPQKWESMHRKA